MISYQNKWTWRCVERWETMKINYQRWRRNLSLREKWSRKPADVSSPKCSQGPGDWLQTAAPVWGRKCQIRDFVEFNSIRGYSCLLGVQNTAQLPYKDDGLKRWSRGGTTKQIFFLQRNSRIPHVLRAGTILPLLYLICRRNVFKSLAKSASTRTIWQGTWDCRATTSQNNFCSRRIGEACPSFNQRP